MMKKTEINVQKIVAEVRQVNKELREGMNVAKLSKSDKEEIVKELEEVIALAETIKSNSTIEQA